MSKIKALVRLLSDTNSLKAALVKKTYFFFSNKKYLELLYKYEVGKELNLQAPKTYTEKLQWLKLYYHNPIMPVMVDKYKVKTLVTEMIGSKYVIPTLGVWDQPEEIEWDTLPDRFVLKTTHGGGGVDVVICKDKKTLNKRIVFKKLRKSLEKDSYALTKEWPYLGVDKRIIAEEYLEEHGKTSLNDYKVMCFAGKAKLIELHEERYTSHHTQDFYDCKWNKLPINQKSYGIISEVVSKKPELLNEMINLSEILADGFPHVRIDWYIVQQSLFFSEITFFDASGFDEFIPEEYNYILGDWIALPEKTEKC